MKFPKDFLSIADLTAEQILELLQLAKRLKKERYTHEKPLTGKTIGLLTTKPSLRTRLSFEIGAMELGAHSLFIRNDEVGLGTRESYSDIANVVSRYLAALVVRSHDQKGLIELAQASSIPVINALTDDEHPCQILADLLTIEETFGKLAGIKLTYVGDGNNVTKSLMLASAILGIEFTAITPSGYEPSKEAVNQASQLARKHNAPSPIISNDVQLIKEADVLYTDVWVSMGQEGSKKSVQDIFGNYQINSNNLGAKDIKVLHCLPAHKSEEISEEVFNQNANLIFDQAENRLHAQKALLVKLLT